MNATFDRFGPTLRPSNSDRAIRIRMDTSPALSDSPPADYCSAGSRWADEAMPTIGQTRLQPSLVVN